MRMFLHGSTSKIFQLELREREGQCAWQDGPARFMIRRRQLIRPQPPPLDLSKIAPGLIKSS